MDDHMVSGEDDERQAAICMCSIPASDRSFAGVSTPRSTAGAKAAPPFESLEKTSKSNGQHVDLDGKEHTPEVPLVKKVAAEFIGTFILMFTVLSTVVTTDAQHGHGGAESLLGVAASAGLAVVAVVLAVVRVSGSHLNPAVSLAMAAFGHLPRVHVLPYAVAHTLASAAAALLVKAVFRPAAPGVMATVPRVGAAQAFCLELVLTFVLMFVIAAVATDPTSSKEVVAISIAAAITMNALVGGPSTGPSMNPARTLGAALVTGKYTDIWVYMVAPPLGAIAGAGVYTLIKP